MTFVLGGRAADGAVLAADRRVLRGFELSEEAEKLFPLSTGSPPMAGSPSATGPGPSTSSRPGESPSETGQGLVVSYAGIQDFGLRLVDVLREKRTRPLPELVTLAKTTLRELWEAYKESLRDDARVDALIAGQLDGRWRLYLVSGEGWAEESPLECLGDGGVYARSLAKLLWDASLPAEELWPLAAFLIAQTSRVHLAVGGTPDILLLRDGGGIEKVEEEQVRSVASRTEAVAAKLRQALFKALS